MSSKIQILHIFGRMERGGAEMRTLDLMRHLDRDRYRLHFCALSGLPGELDDEIRALGGEVHLVRLNYSFPMRFRRLLREHQFNVVHSHVHYSSGLILRLAAKEGTPIRIAHFRNTGDGQGDGLRRRAQRRILRRWIDEYATRILAVSEGSMLASWGSRWRTEERCQVIYNGLDPQAFTVPVDTNDVREEFRIPQESKLYINVSRMDKQKNHERLISIFAKIIDDDATARLLLVGRGGNEIERRAHACAEEFGIADRIIFAGQRSDVPRLLKAADLMIFPSLREGLPGAVLEACAAGIPVLASDLPGVIEIASHFPSVRHLSLNASDANWASEARSFCKGASTRGGDQPADPLFGDTVFNMLDCARAHCMVWQGESPSHGPAANADQRKVGTAG